jgi:pyrroloquinoline-quinone synthase
MSRRAAFERRLLGILDERYHDRHPFNRRMHDGTLTPDELRTWVRNRYYYQTRIPLKDGLILGKAEDPSFRRAWIQRIHDHDGAAGSPGGLALWLALARAVGLDPDDVAALRDVLPGVRRACDAYVEFVRSHDLLESVAASLTELRAGPLLAARSEAFREHYPWIDRAGLAYFGSRTSQAPRDGAQALAFVLAHAETLEAEERCAAALLRKCEILWELLDGVEWASQRLRLRPFALRRSDEPLLVLPERAIELNAAGSAILELCDGRRSVDEIAGELRRRHPDADDAAADTYAFLEQLESLGALERAA